MQAGKNALEAVKEKAANVGAVAKAGMDKTKATLEEKVEKATAQHPAEKQMAEHKKQLKINEAELAKHEAMEHNAAKREHACVAHNHPSDGHAHGAGTDNANPTAGYAEGGVAHGLPIGLAAGGRARPSAAHGPEVETGYPDGNPYSS